MLHFSPNSYHLALLRIIDPLVFWTAFSSNSILSFLALFTRELFSGVSSIRKLIFSSFWRRLNSVLLSACALLDSLLSKVGGTLLFQCNYDLKLLDLKNLSVFYKDVLAVWQELNSKDPRNANEYKQEIIWNNRFIKIDGKSFYYRPWANKGILKISDLLNTHGQFLSFENFKCKYSVRSTFLEYAGVLAAIPKICKSEIVGNFTIGNNEPVPSLDISSTKKARVILAERSFSPPIVEINLRKQVLRASF